MSTSTDTTDPTAEACVWCDEAILPGERLANVTVICEGRDRHEHWECGLRSVTGGVNHLRGKCSCCGGSEEPDPPGWSRRQAARAAAKEWYMRGGFPTWTIYDSPDDAPGEFIARRFLNARPTATTVRGPTLEAVRQQLPGGLICFPRDPSDPPAVVETWL